MRRRIIQLLSLAFLTTLAACHSSDIKGFKKTDDGLYYRFENMDQNAQPVCYGDQVVGELTMRLDDEVLLTNEGQPVPLFVVRDSVFNGYDFSRGLLMMHKGDRATFAIFADTVAHYFRYNQLPAKYLPGTHMVFYYDVHIVDIITADSLQRARIAQITAADSAKNTSDK